MVRAHNCVTTTQQTCFDRHPPLNRLSTSLIICEPHRSDTSDVSAVFVPLFLFPIRVLTTPAVQMMNQKKTSQTFSRYLCVKMSHDKCRYFG